MGEPSTDFTPWLARWGLEPDGWAFGTTYTRSLLLPVRQGATAAMLKIAQEPTEEAGGAIMAWWDGVGAAPVLAHEGPALLMLRAEGPGDLAGMARTGRDDAATAIICQAAAGLHRPRPGAPPATLETSETWFRALRRAAGDRPAFARAAAELAALEADPRETVVLHGDMHHGNVLDFGERGWLAIDPKGLVGERAYDYANIIRNPDLATAMQPGRPRRLAALIAGLAGLDLDRLRRWVLVHAGLSAAWCVADGIEVAASLALLDHLMAELGEPGAA